jgi:peptide/nickel transport system permease protein
MFAKLLYVGGRILQMIPVIALVILVNFSILKMAPGDLVDVLAGEAGSATPEFLQSLRQQFGSDQPFLYQLGAYYQKLLTFDLGYSFRNGTDVVSLIADRLTATILLTGSSLFLAAVTGVFLGWLTANSEHAWLQNTVSVISSVGFAAPLFWVGLMLIVLFSVHLQWLPTGGMANLDAEYEGLDYVLDVAKHMIMPVITLSIYYIAIYARITHAAIDEVQKLDYVRTAHAKGLTKTRVSLQHVLRNALLPVVTVTGMQVGSVLSGALVVETVFAWPGMGRLAYDAVIQRDLNLLLGILFFSSLLVMAANIVADLLYARLDPRVSLR